MLQAAMADVPVSEDVLPQDSCGEQPGTRIGHYKLLEQIGEGGFGVVWMAEQEEPVRRRVALKIIKPGMDTREVVARFEAERQALAMMEHPNIASVFDGGATATGRPYFVMELVKGVPITTYCDANQLSTRERLELFMEVCHAVQHAHQKGVIHRDLKPSNILVTVQDDRAVPKVIDFGVAKATQAQLTGKTLFTRFNQWIGTPEYMSPEQAGLGSLDVDTRSDIYSLGVLLYELLTGRPPFDPQELLAAGYDAVMRTIREEEPPKPSTRLSTLAAEELTAVAAKRGAEPSKLNRLVRGDLDWIVMKSLEKDRRRRYETANGLADDLRRHLGDEAVLARPPSTAYRMKKAWRRNKVWFSAAAVVVLALAAGISLSTWQAVRATKAEALAMQRLAESEAISQFLTNAFQSPDPARDGRTITVAEMLDSAVKKLDTDLADQPARRASLQATIGATYWALGLARDAIPLQTKVLDYYRTTGGPEHPDTIGAMNNLALSYADAGRRGEALKLRQDVLPLSRKVLGPRHPVTLYAMNNLANSYFDANRRDEALKLREEVLELRREVLGPKHTDTLMAMGNLASSYAGTDRLDEALELREDLLRLRREVSGPKHPETLAAMINLANSYALAGRRADALKLRQDLLPVCREVYGPKHPVTLVAMGNLASSYSEVGRHDEGIKLQREALQLCHKVLGPEHPTTLMSMTNLAISLGAAGRLTEAIEVQQQSLAIKRRVLPPKHPDLVFALKQMAQLYDQVGRTAEARTLCQELAVLQVKFVSGQQSAAEQRIVDKLKAKAAEGDAQAQFDLGSRYFNGRGVTQDCKVAVKWIRKAAEQGHVDAQYMLGLCYSKGFGVAKDNAQAATWYRMAADQGYAGAQYSLGGCYFRGEGVGKDTAEAVTWYRNAADQGHAAAQCALGAFYALGKSVDKDAAEAVKLFRMAADQGNAEAQLNLGICCSKGDGVTKAPAEAAGWYRKAAEQGNTKAQINLGFCCERGDGVAKDEVEAYKWYLLAAAHSEAKAKDNAARLELLLTPEQTAEGKRRAEQFKPQKRAQP
jgi:TPR repeat protein/serine/threonine protein kinase